MCKTSTVLSECCERLSLKIQKIQQFKCCEKHLSKQKELKFKDILKYQCQAEADFNPNNILVFPMNV